MPKQAAADSWHLTFCIQAAFFSSLLSASVSKEETAEGGESYWIGAPVDGIAFAANAALVDWKIVPRVSVPK